MKGRAKCRRPPIAAAAPPQEGDVDYRKIGRQIRAARLRRDMTQAHLAEAAELSVPYVSHAERGTKHISLEALVRISRALDVTLDQLLAGVQPQDRHAYLPELEALLADCTLRERRILCDIAAAVRASLRTND